MPAGDKASVPPSGRGSSSRLSKAATRGAGRDVRLRGRGGGAAGEDGTGGGAAGGQDLPCPQVHPRLHQQDVSGESPRDKAVEMLPLKCVSLSIIIVIPRKVLCINDLLRFLHLRRRWG